MSNQNILILNQSVKPLSTEEDALVILEKTYGLKVCKIIELNSYDDRNYHVMCDEKSFDNPHISEISDCGYILKIVNSLDSNRLEVIEGQTELMLFLNKEGITCPLPVKNKSGSYYSSETLKFNSHKRHVVRLLVYRTGEILKEVAKSNEIMELLGKYVANLNKILNKFSHSAFDEYQTIWKLDSVPKIREFMYVLKEEEEKKNLVNEVISCFEERIIEKINEFEKGIIHGDLSTQNIVMSPDGKTINAIIDFGDSHRNCLLFELAICLTYMILATENLESGKFIIRGYQSVRRLSDQEILNIRLCICARICQSLILGLYSYERSNFTNEYLLNTQKSGWKVLTKIWSIDDTEILKIWGLK